MRAHALLGASKAQRWINCPPSARLTEHMPDTKSKYAEEGTTAHELAELKLVRRFTVCNAVRRKELDARLAALKNSEYYNDEMETVIQSYVEWVEERYTAARAKDKDAEMYFEARFRLDDWVPDAFGTCDVVIVSSGVLEVIDLKYGRGKAVSAVNNPQLRLYAMGAYAEHNWLYNFDEVIMTIAQPRRDDLSTETMRVTDLLEWMNQVVKPAAELAYQGKGEYRPGDHCDRCQASGQCRALADKNMELLAYEFKDPALLAPDEIGGILFIAEQLADWAKNVKEYAFDQALTGNRIPQWKLVEGKSNRVITDKAAAMAAFAAAGIEGSKYKKPADLVGITDLEKKIGKKTVSEILGALITKPPGKPALVPESDPRAEWDSLDNDFADIEFE